MLEHLKLNNLALSCEAEVEFTPGMICITGETGAGKSLVVDALGLALGAKADANMVRQGEKQLEVSAIFSIKGNSKAQKLIKEMGFLSKNTSLNLSLTALAVNNSLQSESKETCSSNHFSDCSYDSLSGNVYNCSSNNSNNLANEDCNEVLLRRIVSSEGKSRAYINGHAATVTQLREISEYLVSIHGQHASVRLMDEKNQLDIVDNYGKLRPLVAQLNAAFNEYAQKRAELTHLSEQQKEGAATYKQDRYDLEELKRLALKQGDYEECERQYEKAINQGKFIYALSNLHTCLEGNMGNDNSIIAMLRHQQSALDAVKAYDPHIEKIIDNLESAILHLDDCISIADDITTQSTELSLPEIESKMSKMHELSRRFSCHVTELYLMHDRIENKVNTFLSLKSRIQELTNEVKAARDVYEELSKKLSSNRVKAAKELASKVSDKIKSLSLPDARFDITLTRDEECRPRLNGRDNACFIFSANYGQDLRPLAAVASGGELSRLALAIEVLTASVNSTPTLIFDEVDTGISGRTASAVGGLLKELGRYVQVITVTHLPQVAAKANTQFVVSKFKEDEQVNSVIEKLDKDGRIEEISRMIGGSVITETTRLSAKELLSEI